MFHRTPSIALDGEFARGGEVLATYEFDPFDGLFAIVGFGPPVSIPTGGYDGALCIFPFIPLFVVPHWPSDEFQLLGTVPDDPALAGTEILLQVLVGPTLTGPEKSAAWNNCAAFVVK